MMSCSIHEKCRLQYHLWTRPSATFFYEVKSSMIAQYELAILNRSHPFTRVVNDLHLSLNVMSMTAYWIKIITIESGWQTMPMDEATQWMAALSLQGPRVLLSDNQLFETSTSNPQWHPMRRNWRQRQGRTQDYVSRGGGGLSNDHRFCADWGWWFLLGSEFTSHHS